MENCKKAGEGGFDGFLKHCYCPLDVKASGRLISLALSGGYSSMVEPQIVILDVAGSSPVGHPILFERRNSERSGFRCLLFE